MQCIKIFYSEYLSTGMTIASYTWHMDAASLMTTFHVVMVTNASDKTKFFFVLGCVVLFILVDLVNIFLSLQLTVAFDCKVINIICVWRYIPYKIYNRQNQRAFTYCSLTWNNEKVDIGLIFQLFAGLKISFWQHVHLAWISTLLHIKSTHANVVASCCPYQKILNPLLFILYRRHRFYRTVSLALHWTMMFTIKRV